MTIFRIFRQRLNVAAGRLLLHEPYRVQNLQVTSSSVTAFTSDMREGRTGYFRRFCERF